MTDLQKAFIEILHASEVSVDFEFLEGLFDRFGRDFWEEVSEEAAVRRADEEAFYAD